MRQRIFYVQGPGSTGQLVQVESTTLMFAPNHNSAESDSPTTCQLQIMLASIGGVLRCVDAPTECRSKPFDVILVLQGNRLAFIGRAKAKRQRDPKYSQEYSASENVLQSGEECWAKREPAAAEFGSTTSTFLQWASAHQSITSLQYLLLYAMSGVGKRPCHDGNAPQQRRKAMEEG